MGLLPLSSTLPEVNTGSVDTTPKIAQNGELEAHSFIEIEMDDSGTSYRSFTHMMNAPDWGEDLIGFTAVASLTTHEDILMSIVMRIDANAPIWSGNFSAFVNSPYVQQLNNSYSILTEKLIRVPTEILDISTSTFFVGAEPELNRPEVFVINQQFIITQATVFILNLDEPFEFDRNGVQLGQTKHFKYFANYMTFGDTHEYEVLVELEASGSPLDDNPSNDGYEGRIYLAEQAETLRGFNSPFDDVKVDLTIEETFILPKQQEISYSFDKQYTENTSKIDLEESNVVFLEGNEIRLVYRTGDLLPQYVDLSSSVPLWSRFTITDYASWAFGALTGLFAVVKALPFLINRVSFGRFRSRIRNAALENDWSSFNEYLKKAYNDFLEGNISLSQYKDISEEANYIIDYYQKSQSSEPSQEPE